MIKKSKEMKTTFENLEDNYDFKNEIGIGGCFPEFTNDEDHACYDYHKFSSLEFDGDRASFTRVCSECNTMTELIYYKKLKRLQK